MSLCSTTNILEKGHAQKLHNLTESLQTIGMNFDHPHSLRALSHQDTCTGPRLGADLPLYKGTIPRSLPGDVCSSGPDLYKHSTGADGAALLGSQLFLADISQPHDRANSLGTKMSICCALRFNSTAKVCAQVLQKLVVCCASCTATVHSGEAEVPSLLDSVTTRICQANQQALVSKVPGCYCEGLLHEVQHLLLSMRD